MWKTLRREVLEGMKKDEELTFESLKWMRYPQWLTNENASSLHFPVAFYLLLA